MRVYRRPGLTAGRLREKECLIERSLGDLVHVDSEYCFNVGISGNDLASEKGSVFPPTSLPRCALMFDKYDDCMQCEFKDT